MSGSNSIQQLEGLNAKQLPESVFESDQPLLLKGLCDDWEAVNSAKKSDQKAADYLLEYDQGTPLVAYEGASEIQGRIFYNDDFTGFNFDRTRQTLSQVIDKVLAAKDQQQPPSYYIGSTMVDHWLPGFRVNNDIELGGRENLMSLWLGNRSRVAAHYDFPSNIAVCVAGKRRVTLFPPEQGENLYVGPLEFTPSGQPISLVDSCAPDLRKYPKYASAQAASIVLELEPGDAVMIPSMWWHHIEALGSFNVLVNYWWRSTPAYLGSPLNVLHHAVMSLKSLPNSQRDVWKAIFDQYVFSGDDSDLEHIPEHARGMLAGVNELEAKQIKNQLLKFLKP